MAHKNGQDCCFSDGERRQMVYELHDGPLQHLAAFSILTAASRTMLSRGQVCETDATLHLMETTLDQEIDRLRAIIAQINRPRQRHATEIVAAPSEGSCAGPRRAAPRRSSGRSPEMEPLPR